MWKMRWRGRPRISVLRHGESENNILGINAASLRNKDLYGLTERGVAQIESVAAKPLPVDVLLHSPLRRAAETADILSKAWGVPAVSEECLVEIGVGLFEGRPEADFRAWKRETGRRFHPSGESLRELTRRVQRLLSKLDDEYPDSSLLLVTHGTLLRHLLSAVYDEIDWEEYGREYEEGRRVFELRDYTRGALRK